MTAMCCFSLWRIRVEKQIRSQMQSRISVLIQTIANLSNEPITLPPPRLPTMRADSLALARV